MSVDVQPHNRLLPTSRVDANDSTLKSWWRGIDSIALAAKLNSGSSEAQAEVVKSELSKFVENTFGVSFTDQMKSWPDFLAKPGEIIEIPVVHPNLEVTRIYIVGIGAGEADDFRKVGVALGRKVKLAGKSVLDGTLPQKKNITSLMRIAATNHFVALILSSYSWSMKTKSPGVQSNFRIVGDFEAEIRRAQILGDAVWRARDLIHTPSNIKNPQWLATQAKKFVSQSKSSDLSIEVLSGKALDKFGGLQAIGGSAPNPGPRFIKISYAPRGSKNWPHVVLVGKGITYDTGGVSLKRPYDIMQPMKSDMAGSAAVLATVISMVDIRPRVRVTSLMMCAENSLSGTSARPSDVITQYDGTTVEINNTDAEGRLVVADGLGYAVKHLRPDYLVDIATLTGAATLGLSRQYAAMYGGDPKVMKSLSEIGTRVGERVWHMPLVEEYREALQSEVADLCHTADKFPVGGGSITAALFLEHFAKDSNWIHLDIAGPARADGESGENVKGGTGFGVRLLIEWIASL